MPAKSSVAVLVKNSNTTLVKVKFLIVDVICDFGYYSNTTLVKVKSKGANHPLKSKKNSNTTLVKVKWRFLASNFIAGAIQIQHLLKLNRGCKKFEGGTKKFKYNTC